MLVINVGSDYALHLSFQMYTMIDAPVRLGIISALHQEQAGLVEAMHNAQTVKRGMRNYTNGKLGEIDCVFVLSRIGKVAAAATVATLIERFKVTHIIFTGMAGAADSSVAVGDIVIAEQLLQHDMDATPLFPRFVIPLTGLSHFLTDTHLTDKLTRAANEFIERDFVDVISVEDRSTFRLQRPRVHHGLIASGDEFIHERERRRALKTELPTLLALEMEGAAVAQVCFEFGVPFAVIRTISDGANEHSAIDFVQFIERVAARYAFGIIKCLSEQK